MVFGASEALKIAHETYKELLTTKVVIDGVRDDMARLRVDVDRATLNLETRTQMRLDAFERRLIDLESRQAKLEGVAATAVGEAMKHVLGAAAAERVMLTGNETAKGTT